MNDTGKKIKINGCFHIQMKPYGWELHTYNQLKPKIYAGKVVPKITHFATIKRLCEWVINRHVGNAENFETLLTILKRAEESLESEFAIIVEKLNE